MYRSCGAASDIDGTARVPRESPSDRADDKPADGSPRRPRRAVPVVHGWLPLVADRGARGPGGHDGLAPRAFAGNAASATGPRSTVSSPATASSRFSPLCRDLHCRRCAFHSRRGAGISRSPAASCSAPWSAGSPRVTGATIGGTLIFLVARTAFGEHLFRRAGPLAARLADGLPRETRSTICCSCAWCRSRSS